MSVTGIEIEAERMEQVRALLAGVPKGAERAFSNAINRGLSRIKSQAWKQVKQVYTVQSSALNATSATQLQKASTGNLAGYIRFSGTGLLRENPAVQVQGIAKAAGERAAGEGFRQKRRRGSL